jgi:uncharacterized protein
MLTFLFNLLFAINCRAIAAPVDFQVPPLTGPVVDQANMLSNATKDNLQSYLSQLVERGGAQIQIATVPSLGGLPIEEASIKVTDQWKLGKKKENRGLLILIAQNERSVRIEVGQGLEGTLPDVTASRIISGVIVPRLKEGSPDRAITDGVLAIVQYTDPKLLDDLKVPEGAQSQTIAPNRIGNWVSTIFWLIFILLFIMPAFLGRGRRGAGAGFATGFLLGGMGGRGWGGSTSSGGGWSGGGGGFSGGGASGRW